MSELTGSVLVLGSTGNVGRHLLAELVASGTRVRAHTRDGARAAEVVPGAELVEGELTDELLMGALAGVDSVFLPGPLSSATPSIVGALGP